MAGSRAAPRRSQDFDQSTIAACALCWFGFWPPLCCSASGSASAHDPERLWRPVPFPRSRRHLAQRRCRAVPQRGAHGRGRSARPGPAAARHRSRPDALRERRPQLDARGRRADHRCGLRAGLPAGWCAARSARRRAASSASTTAGGPRPTRRTAPRRRARWRSAPRRSASIWPAGSGCSRATTAGAASRARAGIPEAAEVTALAVATAPAGGGLRGGRRRAAGEHRRRPALAAADAAAAPADRSIPSRSTRRRRAGCGPRAPVGSIAATISARAGGRSASRSTEAGTSCAGSPPMPARPRWS